jgi:hypothetical protein
MGDLSFNMNLNGHKYLHIGSPVLSTSLRICSVICVKAVVIYAFTSPMYMGHCLKFFTNPQANNSFIKSNKSGSHMICPQQPHLFVAECVVKERKDL